MVRGAGKPKTLDDVVEVLKKIAATIEKPYGRTPYGRDMEYYNFDEQVALPVTPTSTTSHEFKEKPVKFLWLYADGAAIRVSYDHAVSAESFVLPAGAIISTRKSVRRVYAQTLAGTGTLYIWGFW